MAEKKQPYPGLQQKLGRDKAFGEWLALRDRKLLPGCNWLSSGDRQT